MSELIFKRMRASELWDAPGAKEVVDRCYAECGNKAMGPAQPDRESYKLYDSAGLAHAIGVFDGDRIVGGTIVLVSIMAHFSRKGAVTESLFLLPEYRHRGVGLRLLQEAKAIAKECGAPGLYISAPAQSRLEKLMLANGNKPTNTVFFEPV